MKPNDVEGIFVTREQLKVMLIGVINTENATWLEEEKKAVILSCFVISWLTLLR